MKIHSCFKDYYDITLQYGVDPKIAYNRETSTLVDLDKLPAATQQALKPLVDLWKNTPHCFYESTSVLERGIIAFCGKLYYWWAYHDALVYDLQKLSTEISNTDLYHTCKQDILTVLQELTLMTRKPSRYYPWNTYVASYPQWLVNRPTKISDDLHRYFKSPIITIQQDTSPRDPQVIISPRLKDYNFASQVDPYQAYQELSMYMGNHLIDINNPEQPISQQLKRDTHGFDNWSFKTHKTESKKYRKKHE